MNVVIDGTDSLLVARARAGNKDAFSELLDRHRAALIAICRRALGDPIAAEDAAHEAILQALLSLDRLKNPDRFGSWLSGIGLNMCRRWLHDRSQHSLSWEELCGGRRVYDLAEETDDPATLAEEAEVARRVQRAVAILPPGQRAAVLLFYLSGLTYAETAATLGVEVGTVKTRLHKARKTLRRDLWSLWKEEHMTTDVDGGFVTMRVADVRRQAPEADRPSEYRVLLDEENGDRRMPIWIGQREAQAIALLLEGVETPRPLTFVFMADALRALGATVHEVRINRLADEVFYADAVLEAFGQTRTVDARPSDAIALALAAGAPIRADAGVIERVGFPRPEPDLTGEDVEVARQIAEHVKATYPSGQFMPEK